MFAQMVKCTISLQLQVKYCLFLLVFGGRLFTKY